MQTHQEAVHTSNLIQGGHEALEGVQFDGLALRAPAQVELRKHTSVRALVAMSQGAERPRQVPLPDNAVFVVTRLGARSGCEASEPPGTSRPGILEAA